MDQHEAQRAQFEFHGIGTPARRTLTQEVSDSLNNMIAGTSLEIGRQPVRTRRRVAVASALAVSCLVAVPGHGQGVPEPDLVMYGKLVNITLATTIILHHQRQLKVTSGAG
jgi:hypothetical protein